MSLAHNARIHSSEAPLQRLDGNRRVKTTKQPVPLRKIILMNKKPKSLRNQHIDYELLWKVAQIRTEMQQERIEVEQKRAKVEQTIAKAERKIADILKKENEYLYKLIEEMELGEIPHSQSLCCYPEDDTPAHAEIQIRPVITNEPLTEQMGKAGNSGISFESGLSNKDEKGSSYDRDSDSSNQKSDPEPEMVLCSHIVGCNCLLIQNIERFNGQPSFKILDGDGDGEDNGNDEEPDEIVALDSHNILIISEGIIYTAQLKKGIKIGSLIQNQT